MEGKKIVEFDLGLRRCSGEVVRENEKTVVVLVKGKEIKRHIEKHGVVRQGSA